ncbi:hypothetical protein FD754_018444, partial [Muntiacus muntjak]
IHRSSLSLFRSSWSLANVFQEQKFFFLGLFLFIFPPRSEVQVLMQKVYKMLYVFMNDVCLYMYIIYFKLILTNLDKTLASGLQTTAMVEYHPDKNEDMCDQLLISVGNKTIEIPLIGLIPSCQLEIEPEVNFGTLVAGSKVYCKEISIINHGSVPGIFKIEYQSQLPIVIFPTSGVVQPKSSMVIKVDFCADQPIVVNEYAKVSLQDRPDIFLNIRAHVVEQIIELLNINNDGKLECISFGSVFFGTSKIERALLYNNSPEPINWVAIMQDDSVGEELGTNIKQRTDVALNNLAYLRKIKSIDITTIISCVPNEGRLLPYQKILITFCFSPKLITDGQKNDPTHRQDYAIFLRFESAGTKDGFLRNDNQIITSKCDSFQKVELALTGSGLPVLLQFDPGRVLTFAPCFMGGHSEIHCVMQNRSKSLPLMYHFKKTAHFKVDPQKGKIDEGCMQNVTCSFIPHQVGVFKVKQFIEIIGSVADENLQSSSLKPFHQIYLYFNSVCKPSTKKVVMKINPGLSPLVSNPTGQFVVKDLVQYKDHAPVAMLQSTMTHIHNHKIKKELKKGALIAFPNDRAASIRSGEDDKNFRTIFTKIPRYNYVDPDFAYTKFEKIEKKSHEKYYAGYIKYLRNVRLQKEAHRKCIYSYNDIDIGLHPASGLKSPTVSEVEVEEELSPAQSWIKHNQLLCTRNIAFKETKSLRRKVLKGLKSHPPTPHEKHDCSLILTPKQIYQVIVGPSVLNFGDVCVNSTNTHLLHIINMLPIHILIQLDVSLEELQKTNQFSYVIPPTTSTSISMIFESPTIGKFWKSFAFTVNNMPGGHILVMAVVLPVRLELSSNELILRPQGFLEKSCFRGTVRMYNHQNYFVKFKWQPINTGKGMAFSIRPAKGTVEPYSSLECEVTWQPGFDSPERGEFILHVTEGNTLTLKCLAHLGHSKVTFLEPRILFSNSPQGLTTWRKAILHNVGQNHAYFKICDQNLLSMIKIVPSQGIIPLGGITVLNISCTPTVKEKFDTRAKVAIRRANDIDLRIGGSVEAADIEIHPNRFNFSGTYIGATHIMPFLVKNKGITRARVEFNLEDADGFSLDFEGKTVRVNFFAASELDSQCRLSDSNVIPNRPPDIQLCYIQATVLRAPLTLSSTYFIFEIPLHTLDPNGGVTKTQNLVLHNTSRKNVEWKLDIRNTDKLFKDGIFKFSTLSGALQPNEECNVAVNFCPKQPGEYTADIPMRLNDNPICYRMLHLLGEIKSPKLLFVPPFIFFNPVPLDVPAVMDVNILPQNYFRNSALSVCISPAKLLDGNEIQPLSVSFPKGRVIVGSSFGINASLPCRLSFKSSKSVSLFTHVLFCDSRNNCKSLLASRETGLPSTAPGKCSGAEPAKRKLFVGMEIIPERLKSSKYEMPNKGNRFMKKEAKDKEFFSPKEGTRTYDFFLKTINAVQTWFSLFGWPEGPHSLRIPETVRRDVCKIQVYSSALSAKNFSRQSDFSKYNKTIYDVLVHLCGKMPPGINSSQSLPVDYPERVIQLHCQHSLLLEFLSAQGACISHVLPEFLLEPEDYKKWIEIASSTSASAKLSHIPKGKHSVVIDMIHFEAWSKRSWTDVFLQIYKVLVLSRVVPYSINNLPPIHVQNSPKVNAYFASSNIYSTPERILLSWMNTIYENYRHVIWKNCQKEQLKSSYFYSINKRFDCYLFQIESHFIHMYTQPKSSEQYLHNCLIVVNVLREIGFNMDIQAADICNPNPILMLMFCVYMYERLPTYLPKKVVPFHCTLHDTVFREIQLKNPSLKSLVYTATIVGRDASDFSLSQAGNTVTISAKNQITITLKFTSRFLHPAEASLLLISRPKKGIGGTTMTFALKGEVLNFKAIAAIKCKSPCYTWQEITVKVKNPFQASGDFNVILVESSTFISLPSQLTEVEESVDFLNHGVAVNSSGCDIPEGHPQDSNALKTSIKSNFIKEFFCSTHTLHLAARGTSSLELIFLPFGMHTRYCVVILSNREIGELIYILEGRGIIPLPSRFIPMDSSTPLEFGSSPEEVLTKDDPVLYLKCKLQQILDVDLKLPLTNEAKEKALAFAAQQQMSKIEYERRLLTGTLESSSIRVAIALLGLTKIENNETMNEWKCQATIEGEWFHGPPILYVGPGETVDYPLTFKPILECEIMGRLILQNEVDGMEHIFDIKGVGKRPLALEYITVDCQVGEVTNKHIIVPNYTPSVLTFKCILSLTSMNNSGNMKKDIIIYIFIYYEYQACNSFSRKICLINRYKHNGFAINKESHFPPLPFPFQNLLMSKDFILRTCIQVSQEAGQVVWYSHLFQNFQQFIETVETVSDFILGGSKITAVGDCSHEIKRCLLLGRKVMTNLDSILKRRDITLPTKSWVFFGRTDAEAETPVLWPPHAKRRGRLSMTLLTIPTPVRCHNLTFLIVLRIRWPKYWSFSFSISPSNEYSGLISFRMDWLDLLAVQGILKESSPTPQENRNHHALLVGKENCVAILEKTFGIFFYAVILISWKCRHYVIPVFVFSFLGIFRSSNSMGKPRHHHRPCRGKFQNGNHCDPVTTAVIEYSVSEEANSPTPHSLLLIGLTPHVTIVIAVNLLCVRRNVRGTLNGRMLLN